MCLSTENNYIRSPKNVLVFLGDDRRTYIILYTNTMIFSIEIRFNLEYLVN